MKCSPKLARESERIQRERAVHLARDFERQKKALDWADLDSRVKLARDHLEQAETLYGEIADLLPMHADAYERFRDLQEQLGQDKSDPGAFIHDWVLTAEEDLKDWQERNG